jgi:hypothetical protein
MPEGFRIGPFFLYKMEDCYENCGVKTGLGCDYIAAFIVYVGHDIRAG